MIVPATAVAVSVLLATAAQGTPATSGLSGRVLFSGLPVPGATVTAVRAERAAATISDDEGAFGFAALDDGVWTLRVEMRGFVTVTRDVAVPFADAPVIFTLTMRRYE